MSERRSTFSYLILYLLFMSMSRLRVVAFVRSCVGVSRVNGPVLGKSWKATRSVPVSMQIGKDFGTSIPVPRHLTSEGDVFCNRELSMKQIKAVGFDMDYTLAQYFPEFDLLAFEGAKEKLLKMGYPAEVGKIVYDPHQFTRGLLIDKQLGNFIKMDRHKYVRVAYHGLRKLSSEERKAVYQNANQVPNYTSSNFVNMDTLFSMVDSVLFAHLVDLRDRRPDLLSKSYDAIFADVRECVDTCHRDGVIKDRVAENPAAYIMPDPKMIPMLKRLQAEGISTFLLTNSLWDYTHVVMNFLADGHTTKEQRTTEWLDLFDVVVVGASKPFYLINPFLNLFRVDTETDTLKNADGVVGPPQEFLKQGKVFQGGNWQHLHKMLELSSGQQILYVGDHMFSDIVRSKRTLGWRTCLIVPELEHEIRVHNENGERRAVINEMRTLQYDLDELADQHRLQISEGKDTDDERLRRDLEEYVANQVKLKEILRQETLAFHHLFHPSWGQLFKAGYQDSRFAQQVSSYACLYTSRASNLASMSSQRSFRPVRDITAHDLLLEEGMNYRDELAPPMINPINPPADDAPPLQ